MKAGPVKEFHPYQIIGKSLQEARDHAKKHGIQLRVEEEDGIRLVNTSEACLTRLNVETQNDEVVRIIRWG